MDRLCAQVEQLDRTEEILMGIRADAYGGVAGKP
jgi:hypothetical protein